MADLLTLPDAREFLRFDPDDNGADDNQLQDVIDGAVAAIVDIKGEIVPTAVADEDADIVGGRIFTQRRPVISVESVTLYRHTGEAVEVPAGDRTTGTVGYELVNTGGVIRVPLWGFVGLSARINYTAGRQPVPANYALAAKELTAHLWRTSQMNAGGGRLDAGAEDTEWIRGSSGSSYALPFKVRELLGIFGSVVRSNGLMVR